MNLLHLLFALFAAAPVETWECKDYMESGWNNIIVVATSMKIAQPEQLRWRELHRKRSITWRASIGGGTLVSKRMGGTRIRS